MWQSRRAIVSRAPLFPNYLVESGNTHAKTRGGFITLAVVFELRELGEASYLVGLRKRIINGSFAIRRAASRFECVEIVFHDASAALNTAPIASCAVLNLPSTSPERPRATNSPSRCSNDPSLSRPSYTARCGASGWARRFTTRAPAWQRSRAWCRWVRTAGLVRGACRDRIATVTLLPRGNFAKRI